MYSLNMSVCARTAEEGTISVRIRLRPPSHFAEKSILTQSPPDGFVYVATTGNLEE